MVLSTKELPTRLLEDYINNKVSWHGIWVVQHSHFRFIFLSDIRAATWQNQRKWHVHPAKTQISLGIRPVWSESSLSAWRKLGSLANHWAHSEDSDQTGRMLHWVHSHFVGFVMRWLIYFLIINESANLNCLRSEFFITAETLVPSVCRSIGPMLKAILVVITGCLVGYAIN